MENRIKLRKFGRTNKQRSALMRSLAESLILRHRITTTQAKAKSLRPYIEKLVSRSRTKNVATVRFLAGQFSNQAIQRLTNDIGPKFVNQTGGYTRIRNLPPRSSDGAKMAIIELIQ